MPKQKKPSEPTDSVIYEWLIIGKYTITKRDDMFMIENDDDEAIGIQEEDFERYLEVMWDERF